MPNISWEILQFKMLFFLLFSWNALCTFINTCLKIVLALKNHLHSTREGGEGKKINIQVWIDPLYCTPTYIHLLAFDSQSCLAFLWQEHFPIHDVFLSKGGSSFYNNELGLGLGRSNWPLKYWNYIWIDFFQVSQKPVIVDQGWESSNNKDSFSAGKFFLEK